jgi:prophage DNA circulation protein
MNTKTALRLLGQLASRAVQRRYIVRATGDSYLLPTEILNDAYYFLRHPQLGTAESLSSVQEFARVLDECAPNVPLEDATVSNETLVEQDPDWARIRDAAKAVLREVGANLEEWEREQLGGGDA